MMGCLLQGMRLFTDLAALYDLCHPKAKRLGFGRRHWTTGKKLRTRRACWVHALGCFRRECSHHVPFILDQRV